MSTPATGATDPGGAPYRVGDRVQILYMSEGGTILADAYVSAVFARPDGSYGVNTVMSDARASFHLVPADPPAKTITRPRRRTATPDQTPTRRRTP